RWKRFCRYLGPTRFIPTYGATLMGFSAIFLLGRAGEFVRPVLLSRKVRLPVSSMFGIYVLERIFDTAGTAVFAGLSFIFLPSVLAGRAGTWQIQMRTAGTLL